MNDDDDRLEDPANVVSPYPSYYEGPRMDFNPHLTSKSGPGSGDPQNNFRGRHDINCTLWVGNLDQRVTEAIIQELFLQVGPIQSVIFPKRKDDSGRNRGFCFVNFFHPNSVPRAINSMQETVLFGRKLNLQSRPHSVHSTNQNLMPASDRYVELVDNPSGHPASSGPKRPFGQHLAHHKSVQFHGMDDRNNSQYSRTVCIAKDPDSSEESKRKVVVVHSSLCSEPEVQIKISNYSSPKISSVLVTPPPSTATRSESNTKVSNLSEDKGQAECSKLDSADAKLSPKRSDHSWKSSEYSSRSEPSLEPTKTYRNVSFPRSNESFSNEQAPAERFNESNAHMRYNQPSGNHWQDYWQSRQTEDPASSHHQWSYEHQAPHQPRPHGRYIWLNANFHQQHQQNYQRFHPYYHHQRFYNNEPFRQSQGYDNQSEMYSRGNNGQFSWVNNNNPRYWQASSDYSHCGSRHQREYSHQNPPEHFEPYQGHQNEHRELINLSPEPTTQIPESTTTSLTSSSRPQNDPTGSTDSKIPTHNQSRHRSSSSDSDASRKYSRSRRGHRRRRYSSSSSSSYSSSSSNDNKQVSSSSHVRSKSSSVKKNSSKLSASPDRPSEYDPHHPQL